jgi:hypothetical protein
MKPYCRLYEAETHLTFFPISNPTKFEVWFPVTKERSKFSLDTLLGKEQLTDSSYMIYFSATEKESGAHGILVKVQVVNKHIYTTEIESKEGRVIFKVKEEE